MKKGTSLGISIALRAIEAASRGVFRGGRLSLLDHAARFVVARALAGLRHAVRVKSRDALFRRALVRGLHRVGPEVHKHMATQRRDDKQGNGGQGQAITVHRGQGRELSREMVPTAQPLAHARPFLVMRRMLDDLDDLGMFGFASPYGRRINRLGKREEARGQLFRVAFT